MSPIRLMIVDTHAFFSSSASKYLEQLISVDRVDLVNSFHDALLLIPEIQPDLVLVDSKVLQENHKFLDHFQRLKISFPMMDLIGLTLFHEIDELGVLANKAIISGYIAKEDFAEELSSWINSRLKKECDL